LRYILILLLITTTLFSARIDKLVWKSGEIFSTYLEKNTGSINLLKSIKGDDLQYLSEIQAGVVYHELREHGKLLQSLIPIGEEMQIHLYKDIKKDKFHFDIIPIIYKKMSDGVCFSIDKSFFQDLNECTNNPRLGYLLKKYYSSMVDFKKLNRGDRVSFVYEQRSRLGKPYGSPQIKASLIKTKGKERFIFADKDGDFYDDITKSIPYTVSSRITVKESNYFVRPLKKMRITSRFTYKRWHPVLKRYRPHLGVDLGARRGTKIYATHSGKVIYAGWLGGYGKVVKISHGRGYMSLYAHQSKLAVRKGQYIDRGQLIGYIGSTGRSTGPHLHFGLYKDKKAVDPMRYVEKRSLTKRAKKTKKITKYRIVDIEGAEIRKARIVELISNDPVARKWDRYKKALDLIEDRSLYEK